jgi:hypothetical protein
VSHALRRVARDAIWAAFERAFPVRPVGAEERRWLLAALRHAEREGTIRFPSAQGERWDCAAQPLLPSSVDQVTIAARARDESWRTFPWCPELAWVSDLGAISDDLVTFLKCVHDGLVAGSFATKVSLKYRSLALTGDEKRLGDLARGSRLFGIGRLTLEMLGCQPDVIPIAWEAVGPGGRVLVFENAEPFRVAYDLWRDRRDTAPYDVLAYGCGNAVPLSIRWLAEIDRRITVIHYVGDLDRPGLDAARSAAASAAAARLPRVDAAPGVHRAMLDAAARFGHPHGWSYVQPGEDAVDSQRLAFLPTDVQAAVAVVLAKGHRIPEEVLGPAELADWCDAADGRKRSLTDFQVR